MARQAQQLPLDDHRPSLKVKFHEYRDQSAVEGIDRLTLNNNKQDPSGLRQYLSYKLFNESGTFASRCNLARVTVNGQYLGIYSNVESVKPQMLERGFGDGSGALFEGTVTDLYLDFVKRFEKKNKKAKYKTLRRIAENLARDEIDLEELATLIDIEAFVRYWAMESLLGFWDSYSNNQNNFFLYRNPADSKFYFVPWGADTSFSENMPLPPYRIRPRFVHRQSLLANRLYRLPTIQQLYHDTLTELMDDHWNEAELLAEVDRMEALQKDFVRDENTRFAATIDGIRRFIGSRRETLLEEMKDGPVESTSPAKRPAYFKKVGRVTASFDTKWYDKTPTDAKSLGVVDIDFELDDERIDFEKIGVYAEHSKWPPVPAGKPRPPSIVFIGTRKSDGQQFIVGIGLSIEKFRPMKDEPVAIGGMVIEGPVGIFARLGARVRSIAGGGPAPSTVFRMASGEATFENAAMQKGAVVKGTAELTVYSFATDRETSGR